MPTAQKSQKFVHLTYEGRSVVVLASSAAIAGFQEGYALGREQMKLLMCINASEAAMETLELVQQQVEGQP